jgi:hypothetical protein
VPVARWIHPELDTRLIAHHRHGVSLFSTVNYVYVTLT